MPAMLSLSPSVSSQSGLFLRSGRDGLYPPHPDILCREGFVLKQRLGSVLLNTLCG